MNAPPRTNRIAPAGVLDTLIFAPFPAEQLQARALDGDAQLRLIKTTDAFVRVRTVGTGPEVVLLSDAPSTVEHFDGVLETLAPRRRVHIIEIPGFGFSWATNPAALTFDGAVAAVAEALTDILQGPAIIGGTCVQAHVALQVAATLPDLCRGLLLAQATGWEATKTWAAQAIDPTGQLAQPWQGQVLWRAVKERAAIDGWYRIASADGYDVTPWQTQARRVFARGASNSLSTLVQTWYSGPCPLPTLDVPAVLLWGDSDPTHVQAGSDPNGLAEHLPAAEHHVIHGGGHFIDLESPSRLRDALDRVDTLGPAA